MKLGRREKVLAVVVAVALALVLWQLGLVLVRSKLSTPGTSISELRAQRDAKQKMLDGYRRTVERAALAAAKLAEWQRRCLPSDPAAARAHYQDWLRELIERLDFRDREVFSGEPQSRQGAGGVPIYTVFPFRIQGRATLAQVVQFLHAFYTAGHLHKIRRLTLYPAEGSGLLDVSMSIEALSLPKADRRETLSELRSDRLQLDDVAAYLEQIDRRLMEGDRYVERGGVFLAYVPPPPPPRPPDPRPPYRPPTPPPPPPAPPRFDHCKYTKVSAILEIDGKPEVWLLVQTTGERRMLGEGESFEIGGTKGRVIRIGLHEVEIELDGECRLLASGETLREGIVLPKPPE